MYTLPLPEIRTMKACNNKAKAAKKPENISINSDFLSMAREMNFFGE